jgi:tetratricopeptide (TPR) repeat protein
LDHPGAGRVPCRGGPIERRARPGRDLGGWGRRLAGPLLAFALLAPAGRAADEDPRRALAERLAGEGRCAAALEVAGELRREGSADADLLLLAGTCEVQLRRDAEAVETLREALRLAPDRAAIQLRLAIALYHLGDSTGARAQLDSAEAGLGGEHAEILLYRGLLLLEEDRGLEAARTLERAGARDPLAVEPVASFYAAVAWSHERDRERARALLDRVEREWPDTRWAEEAARLRARLDAERRQRWARLQVGFEYDDNVVLQGGSSQLPSEISSRGDQRALWSLEAGAEWLRRGPWASGFLLAYYGAAYDEITSFDSHYPTGTWWLDRRLDPDTTLRLLLDGGFAWVDYDSYLATQGGTLSLLRAWGERGESQLYARVRRDDYRVRSDDVPGGSGVPGSPCTLPPAPPLDFCGPPGLDERRERDRDGVAAIAGLRHSIPLPALSSVLRGGYEFEHFDARGEEYTHDAHSFHAGLGVELPYEIALDLAGFYSFRPFEGPTTFPDPPAPFENTEYALGSQDRNEHYYGASLTLARPIGYGLTASASYRYERNDSNAEVFDYDRQVFGVYLSWASGH